MSCNCHCHYGYLLQEYASAKITTPPPCCPVCEIKGTLTVSTMWKIIDRIEVYDQYQSDALRYVVHLRCGPGGGPLAAQCVSILIAKTAIMMYPGTDVIRDLLCKHLRDFLKKEMPAHLQALLDMSEYECKQYLALKYKDPAIAEVLHTAPLLLPSGYSDAPPQDVVSGRQVVSDLRRFVPGVMEFVFCPVQECSRDFRIVDMVQHLNDSNHRWSRERIADWLETLDVDLSFPPEPPEQPPLITASPREILFILAYDFLTAKQEARRRGRPARLWQYLDRRDGSRLNGYSTPQYCIVDDYAPDKRLQQSLLMTQAVQVGEEHPRAQDVWGTTPAAAVLADIYGPKVEQEKAAIDEYTKWVEKFLTAKPLMQGEWVEFTIQQQKPKSHKCGPGCALCSLDDAPQNVETDPLTLKGIKAQSPPHYQQFTNNPTKSKPKKKEK